MSRSALASRSAVLVMHAVFQVPSVVAVPSSRPVIASKCDGSCIPGLQSIRNNVRNEVSGQSPTDVTSGRVAVGYVLIAGTCSLAMPVIVKASALAPVAPFNLNGERVSGKDLGATDASPLRHQTERALSLQPSLLGHEPNRSHEPALAEYALPQQRLLPSHEPDRKSSCAECIAAAVAPERAAATVKLLLGTDGSAAAVSLRTARSEASALKSAVTRLQAADGDAVAALSRIASGEADALERAAAAAEPPRIADGDADAALPRAARGEAAAHKRDAAAVELSRASDGVAAAAQNQVASG